MGYYLFSFYLILVFSGQQDWPYFFLKTDSPNCYLFYSGLILADLLFYTIWYSCSELKLFILNRINTTMREKNLDNSNLGARANSLEYSPILIDDATIDLWFILSYVIYKEQYPYKRLDLIEPSEPGMIPLFVSLYFTGWRIRKETVNYGVRIRNEKRLEMVFYPAPFREKSKGDHSGHRVGHLRRNKN